MKIALFITYLVIHTHLYAQENVNICEPIGLKCEHLSNPLGIDIPNPRLTWMLKDTRQDAMQTAYQLVIGTDSIAVTHNISESWNTGKQLKSDIIVVYKGKKLNPLTKYYWKVNVWDKDGKPTSSQVSTFETGMMGRSNWKGSWISDHHDIHHKAAPYFRKAFEIKKTIQSARAYIAAAGLYELSLNGEKVGKNMLDPMYTRFDKRTLYVVHDVTKQLQSGENAIGVILGNGWYNHQSLAVWDFDKAPWRNRPAFCMDLRIVYTDGTEETIVSEQDWKTSAGPITYNSIYTGEHYDARLEQDGWNKAHFDDSKWKGVKYRSAPADLIISQQTVPIRLITPYSPISIKKIDNRTYVFDMGQNMAGVTEVKAKGAAGTILKIKHGERLDDSGRINLANIDVYFRGDKATDPFQTDIFTLSGRKEDKFTPKFNYKGFRYVEITSTESVALQDLKITSYFMHSDVDAIGEVKTSSKLVNDLWKVTNNAYLSNLMGYPTDCPQREKNGWTGDGHLAIETALYNFDGITVYEKWLADHRDEQQPNGVLPDIIPTGGWGYGTANGLDWTSTIAIIPWQIYLFYGDSRLLEDCYENIKRYVNYVSRISPEGLTTFGRGDWVPVKSTSNLELTSSIYFYVDATILASAAKLFGKQDDYVKYDALSKKIKNAINNKFLDLSTGIYASGAQTELSMPLHWDVVPEDMKSQVAANLNKKVQETDFHLDVGVLGAKALLNALKNNGYEETAYQVAVQDTYPSWGWWVVNGATTLLENWDLQAERDISDNHMMFGEIGGWFFKSLGGILPDTSQPGFKHILLKPIFPNALDQSEVKHRSAYGTIISKWKKNKKTITYDIVIPANTTATFYTPTNVKDQATIQLGSGKHKLIFTLI
ncbi:alpha-L-rhamnosidase [Sphingobacterium faecium]|uniref:alpha-L-rhamnosidase n=1 Tax=Sphingobacterium faecium TaxID=34087 RepID=UPI000B9A242D|nr:alpha-L-rhamnosidase [Sphingobacterium faecium]WGQ13681.1 family 78 glycoside hydrolase catalytic domain [Sphingobacterium faecium]HCU45265.1 alpha-rhamnosidase [Sphingobacterium sp.]